MSQLWEVLQEHAGRHAPAGRLHLPAHRGGEGVPELAEAFGPRYLLQDLTEVEGLDDLQQPHGVLRDTEAYLAELYGAGSAYLLAHGSSQGLAAAIYAAAAPAGIVLLPQNCHRSALQGLVMAGARPVFYPVGWDETYAVFTRPDLEQLERLARTTRAAAVVFVYPSYEGVAFPLVEAVARMRQVGAKTIVDAAHGSHFGFSGFPSHPAEAKADYTILGLHKSGGAITPGALLLTREGEDERLREGLWFFGSSSPSYPVLASIPLAVEALRRHGQQRLRRSREAASLLKGPAVFKPPAPADPTRKLIRTEGAVALAEKLRRRFGVVPEYVGPEHILFLFGLDFPSEAVEPWARAIAERGLPQGKVPAPPLGEGVWTPRDALLAPRQHIPLESAEGRIAAGILAPSPPSIPLVWPGQRLNRWTIEWIKRALAGGQTVLGLRGGTVAVVA